MELKNLLEKYNLLNRGIEAQGGRSAVLNNSNLEECYEEVLDIENKILRKFGLPRLIMFREILFDITSDSFDFQSTVSQLQQTAETYLKSKPETDIALLEEAKANDFKTYDVLPEIGIDDSLFAMFYFEELFKKGIVDAQRLIDILKSIDEDTASKLGQLHYYVVNEPNNLNIDTLLSELNEKSIPYLTVFKNYRPVYPY